MLNMNGLNMYFDGVTLTIENPIAHFHANYGGRNDISISIGSSNVDAFRENLDACMEDFKKFMEQVLEVTDHNIELEIETNEGV